MKDFVNFVDLIDKIDLMQRKENLFVFVLKKILPLFLKLLNQNTN